MSVNNITNHIINHPKHGLVLQAKLRVGTTYCCECPHCKKQIVFTAREANILCETECEACGTIVKYVAAISPQEECSTNTADKENNETPKPINSTTIRIYESILTQKNATISWGSWFRPHTYTLCEGRNLIGRKTATSICNIQLDDDCVSENSVVIEVTKLESGNTFELTVLRATNPVIVNGRTRPVSSRILLNDGDTIRMGNTTLRFKLQKS